MPSDTDILLNQLALGYVPIESGIEWFKSLDESSQLGTLRALSAFLDQAHPTDEDIKDAITQTGTNVASTVGVLALKGRMYKTVFLKGPDQIAAFRLFLATLGIADGRRKLRCAGKCGHWWHRDLGNPDVLAQLRIK